MTEDQIERIVEAKMNGLDRSYMAGNMTEAEYRQAIEELDRWSERELALRTP